MSEQSSEPSDKRGMNALQTMLLLCGAGLVLSFAGLAWIVWDNREAIMAGMS